MKRIAIEFDNNAETFWHAEKDLSRCPPSCHALFDTVTEEVVVSDTDAHAFIAWASRIPGWHDKAAPKQAPLPFAIEEEHDSDVA